MNEYNIKDAVIKLHDVARIIEQEFGSCQLSQDIRRQADRTSDLLKPYEYIKAN